MTLPHDVAIQVSGLSKKYRLFDNARQRLKEALDPWGRTFHKDFWALRDIDLTVHKGHTVGILGRNGSGKSTLLQIITSVLQPTSGTVEVSGRIAALLELGAGFDPDFTGRENIRQYGRLQGLTASETERRLPEIEAFAGIGEFFDREVKTYSSGMFARLAFASVINVDSDILILDEILAVGDARFQQRCFDKINAFKAAGKTILVVSHAMETIVEHCDRALLLERGRVLAIGDPKPVVDRYRELLFDEIAQQLEHSRGASRPTRTSQREADCDLSIPPYVASILAEAGEEDRFVRRPGYNPDETVWGENGNDILDYRLVVEGQELTSDQIMAGQILRVYVLARSPQWVEKLQFGFAMLRTDGIYVYGTNTVMRPSAFRSWRHGFRIVFEFGVKLSVQSGTYFFDLAVFRDVGGNTIRLKMRRSCFSITAHHTPEFAGVADLFVTPVDP